MQCQVHYILSALSWEREHSRGTAALLKSHLNEDNEFIWLPGGKKWPGRWSAPGTAGVPGKA